MGWQMFKRLHPSGYRDTGFGHGFKIRCYPDSHAASGFIYFSGLPEYASMQFVSRYLRPGDNCIDVGAHIGMYALLMSTVVGAGGRVEAFEPNPRLYERLRENLALNGRENVFTHCAAVSDHDDGDRLHAIGDGSMGYLSRGTKGEGNTDMPVPTERLDPYLASRRYALLKADVEGAEPFVLRGAERGIAGQNPPVLLLEMDGLSGRYGVTTDDILAWLRQRDYVIGLFDPSKNVFFETERPWEHFGDERNVIAIARRFLPEMRVRLTTRLSGMTN
jgi:FkbM family methyltransferase